MEIILLINGQEATQEQTSTFMETKTRKINRTIDQMKEKLKSELWAFDSIIYKKKELLNAYIQDAKTEDDLVKIVSKIQTLIKDKTRK